MIVDKLNRKTALQTLKIPYVCKLLFDVASMHSTFSSIFGDCTCERTPIRIIFVDFTHTYAS
jgi:hypothetical protein